MDQPLHILIENSLQIAWDYLEHAGELGAPETASRVLLASVEARIRRGETRRMMLSNKAIDDYKKFRAERNRREAAA
jgi:hypothetical protein